MTLDRDNFNNMKQENDREKEQIDKAEFQKELDKELLKFDLNFIGSEQEKQEAKEKFANDFWTKNQDALNQKYKLREEKRYEEWGGKEEIARKHMEQYQKELASENMNDQWKQQEELARQHEKQNQDAQEKEKKEKEKNKQNELKQEQQNQHDQDVKDRAEQIRQRRLTNEFNRNR